MLNVHRQLVTDSRFVIRIDLLQRSDQKNCQLHTSMWKQIYIPYPSCNCLHMYVHLYVLGIFLENELGGQNDPAYIWWNLGHSKIRSILLVSLLTFFLFFFFWLLKHSKIPSDLTYPEVLLQKIFIYALSCNMSFKMQNFMAIWQKIDLTTYLL